MPLRRHAGEKSLCFWVARHLSPAQITRDPKLAAEVREIQRVFGSYSNWTSSAARLESFVSTHRRLPARADARALRDWLRNQVIARDNGTLSTARVERLVAACQGLLDDAGPLPRFLDVQWTERFDQLNAWCQEHGALPRRRSTDTHELILANWLNLQRVRYREDRISKGEVEALGGIDGALVARVAVARVRLSDNLAAFVAENGRLPRAKDEPSDEWRLSRALGVARRQFQAGQLSPARKKELQKIPGVRAYLRQPPANRRIERIERFIDANGHLPRSLGKAIANGEKAATDALHIVRSAYRHGKLSEERLAKAMSVPMLEETLKANVVVGE